MSALRFFAGEYTCDLRTAVRAFSVYHVIGEHRVPGAANDAFPAAWADGVSSVAEDVSFIDVFQSHAHRQGACSAQSFRRSLRFVE